MLFRRNSEKVKGQELSTESFIYTTTGLQQNTGGMKMNDKEIELLVVYNPALNEHAVHLGTHDEGLLLFYDHPGHGYVVPITFDAQYENILAKFNEKENIVDSWFQQMNHKSEKIKQNIRGYIDQIHNWLVDDTVVKKIREFENDKIERLNLYKNLEERAA